MRKYIYYISVLLVAGFVSSCSKHEISYDNTVVDPNTQAQFRLMYDISAATSTTMNISALKYNDKIVSVVSTTLGNGFPNSAGKYHVLPVGDVKINLYRGTDAAQTEVYNQTITLPTGRQTGFVYDLTQPPMVTVDEPFPVPDPWLDTCCYIRFVNLMYQTDGTTPFGPLTLRIYRDASTVQGTVINEYHNITTLDFKGVSDWIRFDLKRTKDASRKPTVNWSGSENYLVLQLLDAGGTVVFQSAASAAASTQPLTKGLCYLIHANGRGNNALPNSNKRLGVWQVR